MRVLAATFGFLLATGVIVLVDRTLPTKLMSPKDHFSVVSDSRPKNSNAATHIFVHRPRQKMGRHFYAVPMREMSWSATTPYATDEGLGPHLHGPATITGEVIDVKTKEVAASRQYQLDAAGRRIIPHQDLNRPGNFFFLGCSFMFGTGVSESQTLPAQFSRRQNQYTVYNYSFPGWGPNNLDRLVHLKNFANDVPRKSLNQAIYWYLDYHLDRVTLPASYYKDDLDYYKLAPYYYLDNQNHLETEGTIFDHRGWANLAYRLLGASSLLSYFNIRIPQVKSKDFKLIAAIISDMRNTLKAKVGADLIVGIFPETQTAPYLIAELDKKGIHSIDYSNLHAWEYTSIPDWQMDRHPTASQYQFLAQQLVKDLNLCKGPACER